MTRSVILNSVMAVTLSVLGSSCSAGPASSAQNHSLSRVETCQRDYAEVDFCDKRHMAVLRDAIHTNRPNFNRDYILVRFANSDPDRASYAVINARDGKVYPLPFDYFGGYVDERGFPVANKSSRVDFKIDDATICFSGSVYDYQNVRENMKTCYVLSDGVFELVE